MKQPISTAIDIGTTKVCGIAAELDENGRVEVRATASAPCTGASRGPITDHEAVATAVRSVVGEISERVGCEVGPLTVGIAGAHLHITQSQGFVPIYPPTRVVTREDVLQVLNHSRHVPIAPDRELIQAVPREFRLDGRGGIQNAVGMRGSKLEVITHLITGERDEMERLSRAVGMRIAQVVPQGMAASLALLSPQQMMAGVALVDIGGGSTEVCVWSGGGLSFMASVPVGSAFVTSDLSKLLKTSMETAERIKIEHGKGLASAADAGASVDVLQLGQTQSRPLPLKVLCEIIESRMREIATLVSHQIERSGAEPREIVLTGGGSMLPMVELLFQSEFPGVRISLSSPVKGQASAVAIGLVKFVLEGEEDSIAPASAEGNWKDRIRTLASRLAPKSEVVGQG